MATKLYVGNLSYDTTDEQIKELFSQAGSVVSVDLITDKHSGRSKGFAFVEMGGEEAAKAAITTLNNTEVDGRNIVVNEAKPREDRPRGGGGSRSYGGGGGGGGGYRQRRF